MATVLRSSITLTALVLLAFPALSAQDSDKGPLILELPASTRALALGDAFGLGSRDASAVFYHPGELGGVQGMALSVQRFGETGTLLGMSAGTSWFGGGVAVGVRQLSYEAPSLEELLWMDLDSSRRRSYFPADETHLREEGTTGVSETVLSVGYGKSVMGVQAGIVGKLVEKRYGSRKAGTAAIDLGLAGSPGPLTVGLSVQNLGPAISMRNLDTGLPTRFILGVSSDSKPVGPLDISASTALVYRVDGDLVPSVGLEVGYWPVNGRTFVGRVGYRHRPDEYEACPLTFGGAFYGDDIILEYAFLGFDSGDPSHRFSIGWR